MKPSSTIETMLAHRSIRKFTDQPIEPEQLKELIRCGQSASSSSFVQAYSVIRVTNPNTRAIIAEAAGGQAWINEAAEFLVFCADLKRVELASLQHGMGELEGETEHFITATVDVALMAQNVMLAAESIGLGGVFIGGIRNDLECVSNLLRLPDQVYPVFGMCLGWPAHDPDIKPRFPVEVILQTDHYDVSLQTEAITTYDQQMRSYYESRQGRRRTSDWSTQAAKAIQKKKREYLLSFLNRRGWLKK